MVKFILITGGVVSSVGKGIVTSSLGYLLKNSGLSVTCIKIDPYLNIDAGTMSPYEHGEVFVLEDGGEVDLDLGNYERYLDITLTKDNNITSGKIFQLTLQLERDGKFLGKTVQSVPHVTNTIKDWILRVSKISVDKSGQKPDICLIELGGTPGDIESVLFTEALRQLSCSEGKEKFFHVHVTLIPSMSISNEQKSKPAQRSIIDLRSIGLNPDTIICRSQNNISEVIREKISLFGMIPKSSVFCLPDLKNVYEVPICLVSQKFLHNISRNLKLENFDFDKKPVLAQNIVLFNNNLEKFPKRKIGFVGKYVLNGKDCYISLLNALKSSARFSNVNLEIVEIDANKFVNEINKMGENNLDGILIPGGFGERGIEGKIAAARFARTRNIPFLGICLGMQIGVIEFARDKLGLKSATSEEFSPKSDQKVVFFMPEIDHNKMGGNMRLGAQEICIAKNSKLSQIYGGQTRTCERHRHRYEVNPKFISSIEKKGLFFSAKDKTGVRMEAFELSENSFHVGVQFHPEFKSNPLRPSPVILAFVKALLKKKNSDALN